MAGYEKLILSIDVVGKNFGYLFREYAMEVPTNKLAFLFLFF